MQKQAHVQGPSSVKLMNPSLCYSKSVYSHDHLPAFSPGGRMGVVLP